MEQPFKYNNQILNPILQLKKASKKQIKKLDIIVIVKYLKDNDLGYRRHSLFLVLVCKLYSKKIKILYEECVRAINLMSLERQNSHRLYKNPMPSTITLALKNENFIIGDEIFDLKEEEKESEMMNQESLFENFENDFVNLSSVEIAREGSMLTTVLPDNKVSKKRKVIEDKITEFSIENLRNGYFIRNKNNRNDLESFLAFNLNINPVLVNIFKTPERSIPEAEEMRQGSVLTDNFIQDGLITEDIGGFEESIREEDSDKNDIFDLPNIPENFEFNKLTSNYSKNIKALCFNSLLNLCANNKIKASQSEPFNDIHCIVIN